MESHPSIKTIVEGEIDAAFQAAKTNTDGVGRLLELYKPLLALLTQQSLGARVRRREGDSDVVQRTMVEAHRDFHMFKGRTLAEFTGWLKRIHRNNIQNIARFHRADKRDARRDVELTMASEPDQDLSWYSAVKTARPESHLVRMEKAFALAAAIARLPDAQRLAVT